MAYIIHNVHVSGRKCCGNCRSSCRFVWERWTIIWTILMTTARGGTVSTAYEKLYEGLRRFFLQRFTKKFMKSQNPSQKTYTHPTTYRFHYQNTTFWQGFNSVVLLAGCCVHIIPLLPLSERTIYSPKACNIARLHSRVAILTVENEEIIIPSLLESKKRMFHYADTLDQFNNSP